MARPFLQHPIFPFWFWLTYGRLFLAGAWIVCVSIAVGRHYRSATEFNTEKRPPPNLLSNPFVAEKPPTEPLINRWPAGKDKPTESDSKAERDAWDAAANFSIPGNFPKHGNYGYTEIDFGAQWLMGRMIVRGYGKELYNRTRQRQVMNDSFPVEHEPLDHQLYRFPMEHRQADLQKENLKTDATMMLEWMVGSGNDSPRWHELGTQVALAHAGGMLPLAYGAELQVAAETAKPNLAEDLSKPSCGGPLYPPVHALFYAPFGLIEDPRIAYYIFQLISTLSLFVAGFCVRLMTYGRIWTPVACAFLLLYPGFQPGLTLAQNHAVSLAVVMVGWALACRGKLYWGGLIWGLLAFKPVWALAFGLVPLLMWRPRFLLGMAMSGFGLVIITLPTVGLHSWQNWLQNGGEATKVYNRNSNWINLSRDLAGIVRRLLLDYNVDELERNQPVYSLFGGVPKYSMADLVSWALLLLVFAATVLVYFFWGKPRKLLGLSAGFLFLGSYLCCFRFMYYDALLSSMGVVALLAYPKWYLGDAIMRPGRIAILQWYPILIFACLFLLGVALIPLRAAVTLNWTPYVDQPVTVNGAMDYTALAVWAGILNVLLLISYWIIFRVGRRSKEEIIDPTARTCTVRRNSIMLFICTILILLQTYFLQFRPNATLQLLSESVKPRALSAWLDYDYANDTILIIALWLWAGWRMIRGGSRPEDETIK